MEYENYPGQSSSADEETITGGHQLECPVCHGTSFTQETGRMEGRYGYSTHIIDMMICSTCNYVFCFYSQDSRVF